MLLHVKFPIEPFNSSVRDGSVGEKMRKILEAIKPEAAYFTEYEGCRGGILVVDVASPSDIPRLAEPFFLTFNARCEMHIAMTPEDLGKADLGALGKQWG